jgi:DNA-binding IclR family transcriptional regulator
MIPARSSTESGTRATPPRLRLKFRQQRRDPHSDKRELEPIRNRDYAIDDEEIEDGVRCITAPILNARNRAIAALSVSGPSSRITPDRFQLIGRAMLKAAHELSTRIGRQATASPSVKRKR